MALTARHHLLTDIPVQPAVKCPSVQPGLIPGILSRGTLHLRRGTDVVIRPPNQRPSGTLIHILTLSSVRDQPP